MTGLRRPEKEIKDKAEVERILREAEVGRLGTCTDGQPYVVPVSFAYHDGKIVIHGAKIGKKMENIARNPRVCFEVDTSEIIPSDNPCGFTYRYRSVIADGTARVVKAPAEKAASLRLLVEKYAPGKETQMTEDRVAAFDNLAVVEVTVEEMVGKKSPS
jgi:nitroimidazol reductase NimA-like FMN-containing flavoprotein (pyridoxamine 5'-phosphate oxidase superfamily)